MCHLQTYAVRLARRDTEACPLVSVIIYGHSGKKEQNSLSLATAGMPEETCQLTHPHAGNSVYAASLIFLA
jgi:hypothetical protein